MPLLLKVGDEASIEVPGIEKPVDGKVTLVSPALDANSTTVEVWVQVKNPHQTLKPGTSVRLSMVAQSVPDALVVPAAAVLTGADGATTVMVIGADSHAHQTAVKVGIRQEDNIQILDGLKEGQSVVVEGAYGLPDNTKVSVETKEKEKRETREATSPQPVKSLRRRVRARGTKSKWPPITAIRPTGSPVIRGPSFSSP